MANKWAGAPLPLACAAQHSGRLPAKNHLNQRLCSRVSWCSNAGSITMGQEHPSTFFSHVKPSDTAFKAGGLRDFFLYRDLGIAGATNGKVIAHLVKANLPPSQGTGWHYHVCDFQIVIMMKGGAKFMYEDKVKLVGAGGVGAHR